MAHPLLEQAAQHLAQARAINDEFEGKAMPAEAARQMKGHLAAASENRTRVNAEAELKANEAWLAEPQYKHSMTGGGEIAEEFGHGGVMLESERKSLQRSAFLDYARRGEGSLTKEQKAALVENSDGQKLVPVDFAGTILKDVARDAVIRNLATVRPTNSDRVDIGNIAISQPGWGKLETGATATDPLGVPDKETITVHNLNALVLLGVDELDDADNIESIIRTELSPKFAEAEDDAFAGGSGTAMPWAITNGVTQTVTAAAGETLVADDLTRLKYAVANAKFRNAGVYLGHTSAEEAVALLKGTDGHYLWRMSMRDGEPATLLGRPWYTVDGLEAMDATDDAGAGTNASIVYGDVRSGYMVADRRQMTVQRLVERYAETGKIGLLFRHRVGGDTIRPLALAQLLL